MFTKVLLTGVALAIAANAGTLTSVGVFTGSMQEDFEGFAAYDHGGPSGASLLTVMGGAAAFTSSPGRVWVYGGSASWGLGAYGGAVVHDGSKGLGLGTAANVVTLTFDSVVTAFGGYFADDSGPDTYMKFFDADGVQIGGDQAFEHGSNSMDWYGWTADTGIKSIQFTGGWSALDGLQAEAASADAPEPSTLAISGIGLGLAGLLRRRRKA